MAIYGKTYGTLSVKYANGHSSGSQGSRYYQASGVRGAQTLEVPMPTAKDGDKVKVHYTGKLDDGQIFDSSEGRPPLEFTLSKQMVIHGFDQGVLGMEISEKKTVTIPHDLAYGSVKKELIAEFKKSDFPENITPQVGQQLQMEQEKNQVLNVVVKEINGNMVTLDANHPLAGKQLNFDIELVEIA